MSLIHTMRPRIVPLLGSLLLLLVTSPARGADNPEALDELKQGYSLKQLGNCRDALVHFARSVQLEATSRALLNLSDCERRLGDLVAAQGHAAHGRELARQQNDAELVASADEQLADIDHRIPRLTIRLAEGAPRDAVVVLDGEKVGAGNLGVATPANPGAHVATVSARGRADRRFDITLDEGMRRELEVEAGPGQRLEPAAILDKAPTQVREAAGAQEVEGGAPSRVPAYVVLGLGAASIAVGVTTGVVAESKHGSLASNCDSQGNCPPSEQGDLDTFRSMRTVSTLAYVAGAVGLVAGGILWLTEPPPRATRGSAGIWLGPASAGVGGRF